MGTLSRTLLLAGVLASTSCAGAKVDRVAEGKSVAETLDALHRAASEAKEGEYFSLYAPDAVFLGTDASERWTLDQFRAYAHRPFSEGKGWTYTVRSRNVSVSSDGSVAWFDEVLDNAKLGECRGTGVLTRSDGAWRVAQYNLTIPIPNAMAVDVAERIREAKQE
jgi:ketosteroid isomerase-like protein